MSVESKFKTLRNFTIFLLVCFFGVSLAAGFLHSRMLRLKTELAIEKVKMQVQSVYFESLQVQCAQTQSRFGEVITVPKTQP